MKIQQKFDNLNNGNNKTCTVIVHEVAQVLSTHPLLFESYLLAWYYSWLIENIQAVS